MILDIPVKEFIEKLDHDGSSIIHPEFAEPYCRRSFHIQEMIDVCWLLNYSVMEIQADPVLETRGKQYTLPHKCERFEYYLQFSGILVGTGLTGTPHAVAWDGSLVLDPNGSIYGLEYFQPETMFLIAKINITV